MIKARCVGCGRKTGNTVPASTPNARIFLCWVCQQKLEDAKRQNASQDGQP